MFANLKRQKPRSGQESVWDYPRPPQTEPVDEDIRVVFDRTTIARSRRSYRVLETSHPPVYYIPRQDILVDILLPEDASSFCEFKGRAVYWTLEVNGVRIAKAGWSYPDPTAPFEMIRDHVAFYASKVDECWVGENRVKPQEGDFYGGWNTDNIVGPFKGGPGTFGW